jgi:hypothetical protein
MEYLIILWYLLPQAYNYVLGKSGFYGSNVRSGREVLINQRRVGAVGMNRSELAMGKT